MTFWYYHTSIHGRFPKSTHPIIREWIIDVLAPCEKEFDYLLGIFWEIHYIGYLAIYANVGGDPEEIIVEHIKHSKKEKWTTALLLAIKNEFMDNHDEVYKHFRYFRRQFSQQETPPPKVRRVVSVKNIKCIINAIENHRSEIEKVCMHYDKFFE